MLRSATLDFTLMDSAMHAPPRPHDMALPPKPRVRWLGRAFIGPAHLWAWPLLLFLAFTLGVVGWMVRSDVTEREARQAEMISDALSLEAEMVNWLEVEQSRLQALAALVNTGQLSTESFQRHPLALDGVRRFWVSITWVDPSGRVVAQLPDDSPPPHSSLRAQGKDRGMAGHLVAPAAKAGRLVVRYSLAGLLRQSVPWWLARKYDIRLIDPADEVMASTAEGLRAADRLWYRKAMGGRLPQGWLELSSRDVLTPWWKTLPMALLGVFLPLAGLASWMLKRQMASVARAEEAWRTEAAWRTAMEDSLAVGIRARDLAGRLVYVNRTMADMVGYTPEELTGAMPPMPYWHPDEVDRSMSRHLRNMAGNAPRDGYEARWLHRQGGLLDVMIFEAPLVDARGKQIGWMASVLNITERRRMEERERRQADTMAHHARLTMLGEVASTLAHELNQPLSAIISYNAGLLNALERQGELEAPIKLALQRQGEQAAHAGRIVKRIREFLTRREPQREPCDLNAVVRSARKLLQREISRQQVEVSEQLDPALPAVMADAVLVEQVVANLIRNGCDALGSQTGPRRLTVRTSAAARGFVRVEVSDNGSGLAGQTIETLCTPFFSTKAEGMGMGLAICRSIVELHYGGLDAVEAPGGGATLSFTLPVSTLASPDPHLHEVPHEP